MHQELEKLTAQFLNVEAAMVFGMGFATNALNLPALVAPGCLVVSDEKNHASIILGIRLSGATVIKFKHNDMKSLEESIEEAIINGQPDGKSWRKILIVTEGVFSMEGSIAKLPEIMLIKKKYGAYIYLDEAHSIGALGATGRGITDYYGIDTKDIDILMGTFSKSFGSAGGYIAGSRDLINTLRINSHDHCYASSMAPAVAQQCITAMKMIMGLDGTEEGKYRINQLIRNTRYFRRRLTQIGVIVFGHADSPVVPLMTFMHAKGGYIIRKLMKKKIAVVGACYPITTIFRPKIRFCISSAHTRDQLEHVLMEIDKVAELLGIKRSLKPRDPDAIDY